MKIQQIRSAAIKVTYGGDVFLIDPWLEDKGKGMSAPTVKAEMQGVKSPLCPLPFAPAQILADVDTVLVTHIHPDHFTEDYLPKEMKVILQNHQDEEKAQKMGFRNTACFGETPLSFGATTITRVDGIHGDNPITAEKMGTVSGYVFENPDEQTLYIAGDTIYYSAVAETIHKYSPAVIIINCCAATTPFGRLIMNLEDVQAVCDAAPNAIVIASHLDNVNHALLTRADIKAFVEKNDLQRQVLIPEDGETVAV